MFTLEHKIDQLFVTEVARKKWKKVAYHLGTMPDKKVARKIGVSTSAVCNVRGALGIMPVNFPHQCEKYGIAVQGYQEVSND
ncbi:MAG: hypothetical protein RBR16_14075 [Syntrophus sp. (in: bacteria)]|nr:hypothetical protein [Syntrophus sp. (in: bacteria)]